MAYWKVISHVQRSTSDHLHKHHQFSVRPKVTRLAGAFRDLKGRPLAEDDLGDIFGHDLDWYRIVKEAFSVWLKGAKGDEMQAETPLTWDDLNFLREGPSDPLDLTRAIVERKQPRWLMGWRDICRSTDERTVIATVFPKVGTNHKTPLFYLNALPASAAAFLAMTASLIFDYVARQKIGGTSLT
jgi:hypothetical protein